MKKIRVFIFLSAILMATCVTQLTAQKRPVPDILKEHKDKSSFTKLKGKTVKPIALFNGKNLTGWYSYTKTYGLNNDVEKAFTVENGFIRLNGKSFGYLCTQKEYRNYYLRVVFHWGETKYPPLQDRRRDSGILYHFQATTNDKVWPKSIECQIQEEDCGDYYCVGGTEADSPNTNRMAGKMRRIIRTDNFERPGNEPNIIEIICIDNKSEHYVNGHLVNQAHNLTVESGKILLQLEGSEIYYHTVELIPLK
jgi:hypothetical protein